MKTKTILLWTSLLSGVLLFFLTNARVATSQEKKEKPVATAPLKWEYKQIEQGLNAEAEDVEKQLNKLGDDGWELVISYRHVYNSGSNRFVFKRAKR